MVDQFESQVYRADGSVIWISENARAVRDGAGKLLHYEGTVEDVTDLRAATADLMAVLTDMVVDLRSRYPARWAGR
mgnify:CR=1 FL=1